MEAEPIMSINMFNEENWIENNANTINDGQEELPQTSPHKINILLPLSFEEEINLG